MVALCMHPLAPWPSSPFQMTLINAMNIYVCAVVFVVVSVEGGPQT